MGFDLKTFFKGNKKTKYLIEYFNNKPVLKEKYPEVYARLHQKVSDEEIDRINKLIVEFESAESDKQSLRRFFEREEKFKNKYQEYFQRLQEDSISREEIDKIKKLAIDYRKTLSRKYKLEEAFKSEENLPETYNDIIAQLQEDLSDAEIDAIENVLNDYKNRKKTRIHMLSYINKYPTLKNKFGEYCERLQNDISLEECNDIYRRLHYDNFLFDNLIAQYNADIEKRIELNYESGKVETLYRCDRIFVYEELLGKYPEEINELIAVYTHEFNEIYYDAEGNVKWDNMLEISFRDNPECRFRDMRPFEQFTEKYRQDMGMECVITDKEYNELNRRIRAYTPPHVGSQICGNFTAYSLSYENYLKVKEVYPQQASHYANIEYRDSSIKEFINKIYRYLDTHEMHYIV